jgi:hypothetical protein
MPGMWSGLPLASGLAVGYTIPPLAGCAWCGVTGRQGLPPPRSCAGTGVIRGRVLPPILSRRRGDGGR